MSYNGHSCRGMDGRTSPHRIARVIEMNDPDIVALQEIDVGRTRSRGHDQTQMIADAVGMHAPLVGERACADERLAVRFARAIVLSAVADAIQDQSARRIRRRDAETVFNNHGTGRAYAALVLQIHVLVSAVNRSNTSHIVSPGVVVANAFKVPRAIAITCRTRAPAIEPRIAPIQLRMKQFRENVLADVFLGCALDRRAVGVVVIDKGVLGLRRRRPREKCGAQYCGDEAANEARSGCFGTLLAIAIMRFLRSRFVSLYEQPRKRSHGAREHLHGRPPPAGSAKCDCPALRAYLVPKLRVSTT